LNEEGTRDSGVAAKKLAKIDFDVLITSPMKRTLETAQILAGDRVPIVRNSLCAERHFGNMEGCTWDEVQKMSPPILFIQVGDDLHSVNPKGGEPFEDLWQRAKSFRRVLFDDYAGKNVLVVSHGVFLQMLHGALRGLSCIESLASYPGNLEMTSFRFSDECLVEEKTTRLLDSAGPNF